jgi:hypothetical protein
VSSREERITRNEVLFREVNKRIEEIRDPDAPFEIVCECGDADCTVMIQVRPREYQQVRLHRTQFFVVPGHEIPDVETVIDSTTRFNIVEKHADQGRLARANH